MFRREYRLMSHVPRWSIVRKIHTQSIADHTFYVTLYVSQLCDLLNVEPMTKLTALEAALYHDVDETFTGDIPGPSKREMVDPAKTSKFINRMMHGRFSSTAALHHSSAKLEPTRSLIKAADLMDECMYLSTEIQMGNVTVRGALDNARNRLYGAINNLKEGFKLDAESYTNLLKYVNARLYEVLEGADVIPTNDTDLKS
jgi:5'-deoxynucleotidase YfbR-like HD superfamily hydrolase